MLWFLNDFGRGPSVRWMCPAENRIGMLRIADVIFLSGELLCYTENHWVRQDSSICYPQQTCYHDFICIPMLDSYIDKISLVCWQYVACQNDCLINYQGGTKFSLAWWLPTQPHFFWLWHVQSASLPFSSCRAAACLFRTDKLVGSRGIRWK